MLYWLQNKEKDLIMSSKMTVSCTLYDKAYGDPQKKVDVKVECVNGSIYIMPEGYGDATSENGSGCPIMVEIWEGKLRLVAWSDINKEDPTHAISLETAKESIRGTVEMSADELERLRGKQLDKIWLAADLKLDEMGWEYADDSGWEHTINDNHYFKKFFYYDNRSRYEIGESKSAYFTVLFKENSTSVESSYPTY
jgi:hypothetical protein